MRCVNSGAANDIASARGSTIEKFENQSLVRPESFRGKATETSQQRRGDADGGELLGVAGLGPPDAATFKGHENSRRESEKRSFACVRGPRMTAAAPIGSLAFPRGYGAQASVGAVSC